ncbi:hypothetical protein ANN_27406 [Periplaneta americana]|uniref:Uncharacterized protein n=1 Tax=Periplaneta americana TaxID=6978 RepID=A0ABQ8RVU4_PERAM|nr:hypothetical protein ANN_27406 [Periplaneta americana]
MFLLSLGKAMMTPWMEKRLVMQNLPRLIRENIADQLGKTFLRYQPRFKEKEQNVGVIFVLEARIAKARYSEVKLFPNDFILDAAIERII